MAINFRDELYGKKPDTKWIIRIKQQRKSSRAFGIATIEIVEFDRRFTLAALPVVKSTKKEDIVEYLFNNAKKYVEIKSVLMIMGFTMYKSQR